MRPGAGGGFVGAAAAAAASERALIINVCLQTTKPNQPNPQGEARQWNTVPVNGWAWWAYNENSGDTGGIVKNFWQDIHWEKVNFMIAKMGLRPWYLR